MNEQESGTRDVDESLNEHERELVSPEHLKDIWDIQRAASKAAEVPESVKEPQVEVREVEPSIEPVHGRPFENGTGHVDFSVLDPDVQDPAQGIQDQFLHDVRDPSEGIREAVAREVEDAAATESGED